MGVNRPYFIDIYAGDTVEGANDEGFAQVKGAGIAFLDHKISQGVAMVDKMCAFRRQRWMDGNPVRVVDVDGAVLSLMPRFSFYHFNDRGSAADESAHFIASARAAGYQPGDDVELDYEDIGASGFQQPASWAYDFCSRVVDAFGHRMKLYGGDAPREQFRRATSAQLDFFLKSCKYWDCQYGGFNPAEVPAPWRGLPDGVFEWQDDGDQYGPGPHRIAGLEGYCDNSTVVGSMTVRRAYSEWGDGSLQVAA